MTNWTSKWVIGFGRPLGTTMESFIIRLVTKRKYTFIDLFAGAGGLSLGLEQAGFSPIFVNEIIPQYCETYRRNHCLSNDCYYIGDIKDLNADIDSYIPRFENVDLVCGGPPCQGFSMANRQRLIDDPRNHLYKEFVKFIAAVRPKFFIMENVRGMSNKWDEIKEDFEQFLNKKNADKRYSIFSSVLYAEDYGVPQHRERFVVIGNRIGVDSAKIFECLKDYQLPPFILKDVLYGLPKLGNKASKGKSDVEDAVSGFTVREFTYPITDFYKFINGDKIISHLYNHKNRYNNERDIEIYTRLPQGANSLHESIADIMPYHRRNGIFKDKYFKLHEETICKTITSHMKFDCNMYIHPWEARGLSPREAARIQTFPDDYVFFGSQNNWYAQIGNAVPVKLAYVIGKSIMNFI